MSNARISRWIEVLVLLLEVVDVVFGCLPLVHRVEVETGIVNFGGLEESLENILKAASTQRSARGDGSVSNIPLGIISSRGGLPVAPFTPFSVPP